MVTLASKKVQVACLFLLLAVIPLTMFFISHVKITKSNDVPLTVSLNNQDESVLSVNPSPIKTVFVIVMENQNWETIKQASQAAYITGSILPKASYANNYYSPTGVHPSEGNYIWMEAGTNFGIKNDKPPLDNHQSSIMHLTTLLNNVGISWKSYQENIDGTTCPLEDNGFYAVRHNPMVFFDDVTDNNDKISVTCNLHVRPFEELTADLSKNTVARYNFITPNVCNDMHGADGCPNDLIGSGDTWLSRVVPQITQSESYKDGGVLFITWDEGAEEKNGKTSSDGPIGMIVMSPFAKGGSYSNTLYYTHSSLLKTVEEIFNVTPLLGDANNPVTADLSDLFIYISANAPKKVAMKIPAKANPTVTIAIKQPSVTRSVTVLPTGSPTVSVTSRVAPTIIAQSSSTQWTEYKQSQTIKGTGFSFTYPQSWYVLYQKDTNDTATIGTFEFSFFPPGIEGQRQNPSDPSAASEKEHMLIQLYTPSDSIKDFIAKQLPDYKDALIYEAYATIGNKTIYRVSLPASDPRAADFGSHGIVLGKAYSYDIGFTDVMSKQVVDTIGNTIWPLFRFE